MPSRIRLHSRAPPKNSLGLYSNECALFQKRMDRQRAYIIRSWVFDYSRYVVWSRKTNYVCPIELYYQQACADLHIEMRDLVQAWHAK